MTITGTTSDIITEIEAELAVATGARRASLTRRLTGLCNAQEAIDTANPADATGPGAVAAADERSQATEPADSLPAISGSNVDDGPGDGHASAVPQGANEVPPAEAASTPVGIGQTRSVVDKVLSRAMRLAEHPMTLEPNSRFAPASRVQDGLFLSGDGKLLIVRNGDDWQVSEFEITDGELRMVGEATMYPSAQQALIAIRLQMQAGIA